MDQTKTPLIFYELSVFIVSLGLTTKEYLEQFKVKQTISLEQIKAIFEFMRNIDADEIKVITNYVWQNNTSQSISVTKLFTVLQDANRQKRDSSLIMMQQQKEEKEEQKNQQKENQNESKFQKLKKVLQKGLEALQIQSPGYLFELIDVSSNGYIDKEEFKNLIYQIVENQSLDEDIENIFEEFNKENKNQGISKENFTSLTQSEQPILLNLENYKSIQKIISEDDLKDSISVFEENNSQKQNKQKLEDDLKIQQSQQDQQQQQDFENEFLFLQMKPPNLRKQNSSDLLKSKFTSSIFAEATFEDDSLKGYSFFLMTLTQLQSSAEKFRDEQFAISQENLGPNFHDIEWQRASMIFSNKKQLNITIYLKESTYLQKTKRVENKTLIYIQLLEIQYKEDQGIAISYLV